MRIKIVLHCGSLLAMLCFNSAVLSATPSSLSTEVGMDDHNGHNFYISGRHQFDNKLQVNAGTGKSQSSESSGRTLDASSYLIGIRTDTAALFSAGVDKSHARQSDNLTIDSWIFTLEVNTLDWNVFVSPETRDINVATNNNQADFDFASNGYLAGLSYYGWEPFYLSGYRSSYDYPERISKINSRPNFFSTLFGTDTFNQIYALEDERGTIEAGYFFTDASISLSHGQGRSAVDQSVSTVNRIYLGYRLSSTWSIKTTAGTSSIDTSTTTTTFGSLGLTYKW